VTLQLEHVGKRYGFRRRWVLEDIEFELHAGSLSAIAGANGSGKSTLLRILPGVCAPTRGTVAGPARTGRGRA